MQNLPVDRKIYSVSQLTEKIKTLLEESFPFIWISGEISNFKSPVSGHYYFTLKDNSAQISAIMFRGQNRSLKFLPEDGMKITGFGRISVYQPRGSYQIILEYIEPAGIGALQAAFEQLKARLSAEGLFDAQFKKTLPFLPVKIHLITSPTGSVVHDMIRVIHRRLFCVAITIIPVKVQGDGAVDEIVNAINVLNALPDAEVAILARGGGSLEDLSAFNAEPVARALFASQVPIVSAIGHETDFTIADFVADLRAPTPSAAAEIVAPVHADLLERTHLQNRQLRSRLSRQLQKKFSALENLSRRLVHPRRRLDDLKLRLDDALMRLVRSFKKSIYQNRTHLTWRVDRLKKNHPRERMNLLRHALTRSTDDLASSITSVLTTHRSALQSLNGRLQALSPTAVLERGYSITRTFPGRRLISDAYDVSPGQLLEVLLAKGSIICRVEKDMYNGEKKDV
ncbi:MAG: exodeoxyribonuclease VII large subunit [Desulfosalsimonadaceae bacterium]